MCTKAGHILYCTYCNDESDPVETGLTFMQRFRLLLGQCTGETFSGLFYFLMKYWQVSQKKKVCPVEQRYMTVSSAVPKSQTYTVASARAPAVTGRLLFEDSDYFWDSASYSITE